MKIRPNCAARTHKNDIRPIVEISQKVGLKLEAATFLGSSPIRRLVEDWTVDHLQRITEEAVKFAVSEGLPVMYVTEDTIRTDPETVKALYSTAIRCGARAAVLCDTVGHATPRGAYNLVSYFIENVVKPSGEKIRVDWHGHNDRGLSIANSLAAIAAGADQVHGAALSLGERVGNTPMELMLVNLRLMGLIDHDLSRLKEYSEAVSRATHTPIPPNYPVIGRDAFRTATGVHAAAIVKAYKKNDRDLANAIYSGVPSHLFGLEQIIEVGPLSGKSNVIYWLEKRGIAATDERVERIFAAAKQAQQILTEAEILALVEPSPQSAARDASPLAARRRACQSDDETFPRFRYSVRHGNDVPAHFGNQSRSAGSRCARGALRRLDGAQFAVDYRAANSSERNSRAGIHRDGTRRRAAQTF